MPLGAVLVILSVAPASPSMFNQAGAFAFVLCTIWFAVALVMAHGCVQCEGTGA
jgi:hypothetical protein